MKKLTLLSALALFSLTGCQAIDGAISPMGNIKETVSKFDGIRTVSMTPVIGRVGLGGNDADAKFGLYWDTDKGNRAFLTVELGDYINFSPNEPLEFKVDGNRFKLQPVLKNDHGQAGESYTTRKNYWISKEQILKIANAKQSYYRIYFTKGDFSDGEITYKYQGYKSYVPHAFNTFYGKVWEGAQ